MTARLDGKVVLVTGASSGIGAATARLVADRGGITIVTDLEEAGAARVAAAYGGLALKLDVTVAEDWAAAITAAVDRFGRIDGLVSNAGIGGAQSIIDMDIEQFRAIARVHVEGAFIGIQQVVAQMRRQASPATGSIVVTSSVMAAQALPNVSAYAVAKAALANMAKAIGVELGRKGDFIRVNSVAPGPTRTPMLENAVPEGHFDDPASWGDIPLGGFQSAEEIAETIAFLLSDESSFITAATLTVDGGWSLT